MKRITTVTLFGSALLCLSAGCQLETDNDSPQNASLRFPILPAEECGSCHVSHYEEWKGSLMAYMAVSPFFNGLEISVQELVGRNRLTCPEGAGVLRRAERDDKGEIDPLEACVNDVEVNGNPVHLSITGAGGEHWCVNCHIPSENTYRNFVPPGEKEPLVEGVPTWKRNDPASRRPLVEILSRQSDARLAGEPYAGIEGKTMMQGATCDACHQFTRPVISARDAQQQGVLDDPLDPESYQGNPFWTSFVDVQDEALTVCRDTLEDGTAVTDPGDPCKLLFREEDIEGDGISNSGYYLDTDALPVNSDPELAATAGSWRFGPLLTSDVAAGSDTPPVPSSFHNSSHAPVDLSGDPVWQNIVKAGIDDERYVLATDPEKRADYFRTSELCGACHDVRIIGTDTRKHVNCTSADETLDADCFEDEVDGKQFEPYKRLRDGYSEWRKSEYANVREAGVSADIDANRVGESVVTCQDCHMSTYPVYFSDGEDTANCQPYASLDELRDGGMSALADKVAELETFNPGFSGKVVKPGCYPLGQAAVDDGLTDELPPTRRVSPHYFTGVDVPLDPLFDQDRFTEEALVDPTVDAQGIIKGLALRRDLLLMKGIAFQMPADAISVTPPTDSATSPTLNVQLLIENVGAGHRIPAGFTQEREMWVELIAVDEDRAPPGFECSSDSMIDLVYQDENYARLSRCASQARFPELFDRDELEPDCTELETAGSLEEAIKLLQSDLGVLAHMGALIDQDHAELTVGNGPSDLEACVPGSAFCDQLNYEALRGLFDVDGALLDTELTRALDNRLFLLELEEDGTFDSVGATFDPGELLPGELRLVELADGNRFDEDIPDKVFTRIRINDLFFENNNNNLIATYGMDVLDGPYTPTQSTPAFNSATGEIEVSSRGLINFQNGFLRCVACCPEGSVATRDLFDGDGDGEPDDIDGDGAADEQILCLADGSVVTPPLDKNGLCCRGTLDEEGNCELDPALPRATNLVDGIIDLEDGVCSSNMLVPGTLADAIDPATHRPAKFFEIFSPIGGLTADTGVFKAADGIINERSLPPGIPHRYSHTVQLAGEPSGNLCVEARLNFRAFPPYLLRTFSGRELLRLADGQRQAPTMSFGMIDKLDVVVIGKAQTEVPGTAPKPSSHRTGRSANRQKP